MRKKIAFQSSSFIFKLVSALCYSVSGALCLMNANTTNILYPKGCFWNPEPEYFTCVISVNGSTNTLSKCKDSCPRACSEHYWKCNDLCIPVTQECDGECMPKFTHSCNGICIPTNKPCNSLCFYTDYQINCNGQCLYTKYEKELINKNGCKGEIYRWKFSNICLVCVSLMDHIRILQLKINRVGKSGT